MKLIKIEFLGVSGKVKFIFSDNKETKEFILKEQPNWPVLIGQLLELVEKWLREKYLNDINFATFGALGI